MTFFFQRDEADGNGDETTSSCQYPVSDYSNDNNNKEAKDHQVSAASDEGVAAEEDEYELVVPENFDDEVFYDKVDHESGGGGDGTTAKIDKFSHLKQKLSGEWSDV